MSYVFPVFIDVLLFFCGGETVPRDNERVIDVGYAFVDERSSNDSPAVQTSDKVVKQRVDIGLEVTACFHAVEDVLVGDPEAAVIVGAAIRAVGARHDERSVAGA